MKSPALVALIAALLGAVLGLVQEPFNLWYIGIWAFPAALWLIDYAGRRFLVGYFFGLGYFLLVMNWVREPFLVGPPEYAWMSIPAWLLMAFGLALFWWPVFALRSFGTWAIALSFAAFEFLRGWLFTGLPWGLVAYGFVDTPFAQSAAIYGPYLLSGLLIWVAMLLASPGFLKRAKYGMVIAALTLAYGIFRAEPDDASLAEFRVRVLQANISQADRWNPDKAVEQLNAHIALSEGDADLVIWPESATSFSPIQSPELIDYLRAGLNGKALIFGAPSFEDGAFYNSAYVISGDKTQRYDKMHLVPFGEYIPFGDWLAEKGLFTRTVAMFSARKGHEYPWTLDNLPRPNIMICYEGIFPNLARRDGEYLVQITNDTWFGSFAGPQQHLASARFRAIETGKPLARAATTGISAIIDANGRIVEAVPLNESGSAVAPLGNRYERTLYGAYGDWILAFWLMIGGGLLYLRSRKRLRRKIARLKKKREQAAHLVNRSR